MLNATPLLKLYAGYRSNKLNSLDPIKTQETQLLSLIAKAKDTDFGRAHNFNTIKSVKDYQAQVPLRSYEQFWDQYWSKSFPKLNNCTWPGLIPFFAVSSGTSSGATKYIPFTNEMQKSNTKAGTDLLVYHLDNCPNSKIFAGKSFMLGGSTDLVEQAPGIYSGDLSGIAVKTLPWWAKQRYFPDQRLALLKNWEEKIERLSIESFKDDIRMISGVPSWMLIFFDALFKLRPDAEKLLHNFYPNLEMLVHGGVSFAPYHSQFKELLSGSRAELREVYPASEGFIAVADNGYGDGLRLSLDHQMFLEFVPVEELDSKAPTRYWLKDVECNKNYAIVLTTCAGLWSYILGDTVRFINTNPARILITGRISYYLSAFGEHLIAEEIDDAINAASRKINCDISDYAVGAVYPKHAGDLGGHLYVVEFADHYTSKEQSDVFSSEIDNILCKRNEDYEAHRAKGFGLKAPTLRIVKQGTFKNWMASRGKLGGQNKVPRIISNQELFDNLIKFTDDSLL
jgi:GH3 auxin-responsive promoter